MLGRTFPLTKSPVERGVASTSLHFRCRWTFLWYIWIFTVIRDGFGWIVWFWCLKTKTSKGPFGRTCFAFFERFHGVAKTFGSAGERLPYSSSEGTTSFRLNGKAHLFWGGCGFESRKDVFGRTLISLFSSYIFLATVYNDIAMRMDALEKCLDSRQNPVIESLLLIWRFSAFLPLQSLKYAEDGTGSRRSCIS